jgi:hypothetical protein
MAKAGDAYRELVAAVMAVLDPGSAVKSEQWITGPDGERDMDVEVRGLADGVPQFILVECKDHTRPIGIGFVDAFESKIRDLLPNRAIMFSNSGFTRDAVRKARRVGIEVASAMKAKDGIVRFRVQCEIVARRLQLMFETVHLFPFDGQPPEVEENWKVQDLLFDGSPIIGWISEKMKRVAAEHHTEGRVWFLCTFRHEPRWAYRGQVPKIGGLKFSFLCQEDWVSQITESQVSLGYYDHLKRSVVIPNKQWYTPGVIDNDAWEPTDERWSEGEMQEDSLELRYTITRSNLPSSPSAPNVDDLIADQRVDVDELIR